MATKKITDIFCDFLGDYCSRTIWNEPQKEYRHNIKLSLQKTRPQINVWSMSNESVVLPDGSQYFVYTAPLGHFAGLDVRSSDWQTVTALLSNTRIQLRVHDSTGKRLFSDKVFLRSSSVDKNLILIAIDTKMLDKCVDTNEKDIYIGVYFDSDYPNDININCYIANNMNKNDIITKANVATYVFKNGFAIRDLVVDDIAVGDYVEVIKDNNIVETFTMDLSVDGDARMYISHDGQSKYIIHVPKEKNPDNRIVSHDTCDFLIFPRNLNDSRKLGRFFHRAQGNEKSSFIQLTHNDFGVPTSLVDEFRGFLGTDEVILYGYIRYHERKVNVDGVVKDRVLVRDKNYLDFLYQLSDEQILDFLEQSKTKRCPACGTENPSSASVCINTSCGKKFSTSIDNIPFWSAAYLEESNFIDILKDTSVQQLEHSLDFYTEALGYVNTASLLSKRIFRYTGLSGSGTLNYYVTLPLVYQWKVCPNCGAAIGITLNHCPECGTEQDLNPLMAIVYINGKKLKFSQVTSEVREITGNIDNTAQLATVVNLSNTVLTPTDEVIFEICERKDFTTYILEPTISRADFYVSRDEFDIYEEVTLIGQNVIKTAAGIVDKKYIKLDEDAVTVERLGDVTHIGFPASRVGKRYILQSKKGSLSKFINLADTVVNNDNIVVIPSDNGHTTVETDLTPTAQSHVVESQSEATGVDVYKLNGTTYEKVTTKCAIEDISISKIRVTIPESLYGSTCKIVFYMEEQSVPVLVDQQLVIYLNGKVLVEDTDYMRVRPATNIPYQYVINNVSYIETDNNYIEIFGTDAEAVAYTSSFVKSEYLNSKPNPLIFYSNFTLVFTDGQNLCKLRWVNGRLENTSTKVPTLHGALFMAKTDIPPTVRKYLKEEYLAEDIERFGKIMNYFSKLTPDDPAIYTIPHSHRIYSVYLNAIIDDVLEGRLVIPSETDIHRLLEYVVDYEYLKKYDLPLKFIEEPELDINDRPTGRIIKKSVINRTFVDVFPSYTQRLVPGTTMYATLNLLIDYTVPKDTVVDTVGVDTTINNNQGHE